MVGTQIPFSRILDNLLTVARERPIVIQSLFFTYQGRGPSEHEICANLERQGLIQALGGRIDRVQVCTVAPLPADPRVEPVADVTIETIAARVRALGLMANVYGSQSGSAHLAGGASDAGRLQRL